MCSSVVSGVDNKSHDCTHIGNLPLTVCNDSGAAVKVVIRNVRCVPSFTDSLISIRQLWLESKVDVRFGDQCVFITSSGVKLPFVPAKKNLFIWRAARGHAPQQSTQHSAVTETSDGKSMFIHSSKSISHIASLHPDQAAVHLHRRLHVGAKRMQSLPRLTADAPDNLSRSRPVSYTHLTLPTILLV